MGDMSLYERVLRELTVLEGESLTIITKNKCQKLRHNLMFILPFWNSRLSEYWTCHNYEQLSESRPQYFEDSDTFVDYWLQQVGCSSSILTIRGDCDSSGWCLWHGAFDFYSCAYEEEEDYDWIRCTEAVLVNLDYVLTEPLLEYLDNGNRFVSLTSVIKGRIRAIAEGLGVVTSFRKAMAKWNFEDFEHVKLQILDFYRSTESLAHRATDIFVRYIIYNGGDMNDDEFSILEEKFNNAQFQAKEVYLQVLRALKLNHEDYRMVTCKTLIPSIDDLQNILKSFIDDLPPSDTCTEAKEIVLELEFIRSIINHTSEQSSESWVAYAIATHIDVLAAHAVDASNVTCSFDVEQKITDIRNNVRNTCRNYNMVSGCIGGLLSYLRLVGENNVAWMTSTAIHMMRLEELHTFLTNTEYLLCLSPEFQNTFDHIEQMFCGAWWDLRSLCFKKLKSNELDFHTICLDFLKGITANMAQPNELLLVLIQSLVQMPDAKFLLLQLRESIVPTEKDKLFANLMYSRGRSLVNLIESDTTSNIIRDVDLGGTEATQMYILFFSDLNDGVSSSLLEPVEGFKASVGQAYAEYIKLPHMELPKSELEFLDMILTLAELKESDAYLSVCIAPQIGVLHDYSLVCSSFLQRYAIRHNESEEVKGLWSRIMNFCRQMNNILDNFEEFPDWFLKVRLFSVIEEVKLITEEIYANDTVKIGVKRFNDSTQSQTEKFQAVEHSDDDLQSKDEDQKLCFEEEDNLTTQLTTGSKNLEKIAIVGMAGLGKTTLAMNLYKRCAKSFYAQAWCYVGQEFQRKELLRDIIIQILEQPSSKIKDMGVEDLAKELKQSLIKKKNYLIVLDDVWDIDAWNALQKSFSSSNNGSRILITSRLKTVGEKVCDYKNVIELNFFSKEKSWYLLEKKVFGGKKCPQNLRDLGKGIAEKCEGLPLSLL